MEMEEMSTADILNLEPEELASRSFVRLRGPDNKPLNRHWALTPGTNSSSTFDMGAMSEQLSACKEAVHTSMGRLSNLKLDEVDPVLLSEESRGQKQGYYRLARDRRLKHYGLTEIDYDTFHQPGNYAKILCFWGESYMIETIAYYPNSQKSSRLLDPFAQDLFAEYFLQWLSFREYHYCVRVLNSQPMDWKTHVDFIQKFRKDNGLAGEIRLSQNRWPNDALDDWKEFQVHEYLKLEGLRNRLEEAERALAASEGNCDYASSENSSEDYLRSRAAAREDKHWIREKAEKGLQAHINFLDWIAGHIPILPSESSSTNALAEKMEE